MSHHPDWDARDTACCVTDARQPIQEANDSSPKVLSFATHLALVARTNRSLHCHAIQSTAS